MSNTTIPYPSSDEIISLSEICGYYQYRSTISKTLFFMNSDTNTKINVYYTTRSLMTLVVDHPTRGTNQMWRSNVYEDLNELQEFFLNPRLHTNKGYRKATDAKRGCAGCGELKDRSEFSMNQWKVIGPDRNRCKMCVASGKGKGFLVAVDDGKKEDQQSNYDDSDDDGDDLLSLENEFEMLELTDGVGSGGPTLTEDMLRAHTESLVGQQEEENNKQKPNNRMMMGGMLERRQFNCPDCPRYGRGPNIFFKKVPAMKPVVKCPKCKKASRGKCNRLFAVPREEERGYGLYRCRECGDKWGSSRAVGGIGQECFSCVQNGKRGVMVTPFRMEVPKRKLTGGRRARRVPREPIGEDQAEERGYGQSDQRRNNNAAQHSNNNGFSGGTTTMYDYEPNVGETSRTPPTPTMIDNISRPGGYTHRCAGCSTGLCKNRKVPRSKVHDVSDGNTVSTSASIVTNSSIDKSDFLDRDREFCAVESEYENFYAVLDTE